MVEGMSASPQARARQAARVPAPVVASGRGGVSLNSVTSLNPASASRACAAVAASSATPGATRTAAAKPRNTIERSLRHRAGVDHDVVVGALQRTERDGEPLRPQDRARVGRNAAGGDEMEREERSRVMMWRNEAVPRISSAMPGAPGSTEIAAMLGALSDRSTRTTRPCWESARAKAMAADVVPTLRATPTTLMRLPASPARRSSLASRSVEPTGAPVAAPAGAAGLAGTSARVGGGDGRSGSGTGSSSGTSGGTKRSAAVAWKAELSAATIGAAGRTKLGTVDDLVEFARRTRVDLVIFSLPISAESAHPADAQEAVGAPGRHPPRGAFQQAALPAALLFVHRRRPGARRVRQADHRLGR